MVWSDWNKGWGGWQDGPDHLKIKLNLPTNINLDVLNGCRTTQTKTTFTQIEINQKPVHIDPAKTIIVDSGTSGIYFIPTYPVENLNSSPPKIRVGTASGKLAY